MMASNQAGLRSREGIGFVGLVVAAAVVGAIAVLAGTPLALGLVAVLCAWLLATMYLRAAVIAAVFLLPILPVQLYVNLGASVPLVTAGRVVVGVILLGAATNVALGRLSISRTGIGMFMLFWIGAGALSIPGSIDVGVSQLRLGLDIFEYFGLFYVVVSVFERDELQTPLYALVAAGTTNALFALFEFLFFNPFLKLPGASEGLASRSTNALVAVSTSRLGLSRVQGSFQTAPYLAASLAMTIPVCYALLVLRGRGSRRLLPCALALQVAALVLSFTRAGWFAAIFAIFVVILFAIRHAPRVATHVLACVCVVLILAVALPSVSGKAVGFVGALFTSTQDTNTTTSGYRLLLIHRSLQVAHERPVDGWGIGTFDEIGIDAVRNGLSFQLTSPDNHFIRVIVETGIVGLIAFVALLLAVLGAGLRSLQSQRFWQDRVVAVAIWSALIGYVFVNGTISAFPIDQVTFVFWILAAVLVRLRVRDGDAVFRLFGAEVPCEPLAAFGSERESGPELKSSLESSGPA